VGSCAKWVGPAWLSHGSPAYVPLDYLTSDGYGRADHEYSYPDGRTQRHFCFRRVSQLEQQFDQAEIPDNRSVDYREKPSWRALVVIVAFLMLMRLWSPLSGTGLA